MAKLNQALFFIIISSVISPTLNAGEFTGTSGLQTGQEKGLVELKSIQQFTSVVENAKGTVVVFVVSPWCGICHKIKPDVETAAKKAEKSGTNVYLLDESESNPWAQIITKHYRLGMRPTLAVFRNGRLAGIMMGAQISKRFDEFLKSPDYPEWWTSPRQEHPLAAGSNGGTSEQSKSVFDGRTPKKLAEPLKTTDNNESMNTESVAPAR